MKKLLLVTALLAASGAMAGSYNPPVSDSDSSDLTTVSDNDTSRAGFYAGGAIGWTKQDLSDVNDDDVDYKYVGGQVNAGYAFEINDKLLLGPELGWGYYGKFDVDGESGNAKSTGYDLVGTAQYYFKPQFDLIVKAGIIYGDTSDEIDGYTTDDNDVKPIVGLGFGYDLDSHVNLNLTYYRVFGDDAGEDDTKVLTTDSVFVGATYRF